MSAYHIEIQMPSGMKSRGTNYTDGDKAHVAFDSMLRQLTEMGETADLVMFNEIGEEIAHAHANP